jgi:hypothetical protein
VGDAKLSLQYRATWNTNANNVLLHEYGMELSGDNAKC